MATSRIEWHGEPSALRGNIPQLAKIVRARVEGAQLNAEESGALAVLASEQVMAVALRYAEVLVEGEVLLADAAGQERKSRHDLLEILVEQRAATLRAYRIRHKALSCTPNAGLTAPLEASVMRKLGGAAFAQVEASASDENRSCPDTEPSVDEGWRSLISASDEETLPKEVRRLRRLDNDQFLQLLIDDARGPTSNSHLGHDAVVERWTAYSRQVEQLFRGRREQAHDALVRDSVESRLTRSAGLRFLRSAHEYAAACARNVMAQLTLLDFQGRVAAVRQQAEERRLSVQVPEEATARFAVIEPRLAGAVVRACAEHRASCATGCPPNSFVSCVEDAAARANQLRMHPSDGLVPWAGPTPEADLDRNQRGLRACTGSAAAFVCPEVQDDLVDPKMPAVVDIFATEETDLVGMSWVTGGGVLRTLVEAALGEHDGMVRAVCRAALEMSDGTKTVHLYVRHPRAAAVINHVLHTGTVAAWPDPPLADTTLALLLALSSTRLADTFVEVDTCGARHAGLRQAGNAARTALRQAVEAEGFPSGPLDELNQHATDEPARAHERLAGPQDEGDDVWWVATGPQDNRRSNDTWQIVLRQVHLDGRWCPLPDGPMSAVWNGRRLTLRADQWTYLPDGRQIQTVTLRRRGGEWEISEIQWPETVRPGVIVTFRWPAGSNSLSARTRPLPQPVRLDEVVFRDEYDPQVVTRELVPGTDQDREIPDLSDVSWIMRTLRRLGYLSADGTAVLAEDALAHNCLELGMPRSMLTRLPSAVQKLCDRGVIERIQGSRDGEGRPWYPARAGQERVDLLRYTPQTRAVEHDTKAQGHHGHQDVRRGHWVTGFVRRLPEGAQASDEQTDLHREAERTAGVVHQPLREGYTFVRQHRRGQHQQRR